MYTKNKKFIETVLDDYKKRHLKKEAALQAIQNIVGEEIERKDLPADKYEVDESEAEKE
jgi:hypothetical protein